jgi:hypothetical protein
MVDTTSRDVMARLIARGLTPVQAAALTGHGMQESSLNPNAYNPAEGAFGAIQWREGRLDNLKKFAGSRGKPVNDLDTQLDFIIAEMGGPEKKAGSAFLASTDLPSAHAALKRYIRYGDKSDATRLGHAQALLGGGGAPVASAPVAAAPFGMAVPTDPAASAAGLQQAAQVIAGNAQDEQQEPFEMMKLEMARPVGLSRIKEMVAAMKRGGVA